MWCVVSVACIVDDVGVVVSVGSLVLALVLIAGGVLQWRKWRALYINLKLYSKLKCYLLCPLYHTCMVDGRYEPMRATPADPPHSTNLPFADRGLVRVSVVGDTLTLRRHLVHSRTNGTGIRFTHIAPTAVGCSCRP